MPVWLSRFSKTMRHLKSDVPVTGAVLNRARVMIAVDAGMFHTLVHHLRKRGSSGRPARVRQCTDIGKPVHSPEDH